MKRLSFPRSKRITSSRRFKAILARGLRAGEGMLVLYAAENNCDYARLGVSVGKSCGNAVVRNRLKRLLREVFRQSQDGIAAGFDYLIIVSPKRLNKHNDTSAGAKEAVKRLTYERIKDSFVALANRATGKIG